MGVPNLFLRHTGTGCNCLFKDNNKGRLSAEPCAAFTSLEASTATAVQCDGGVEDEGEGEEQRKRETDWVVIKGLFFLPTEEHLHSSHLLRGDRAAVCVFVCLCAHTHPCVPASFLKGWPLPPELFPNGSLTVCVRVRMFNVASTDSESLRQGEVIKLGVALQQPGGWTRHGGF